MRVQREIKMIEHRLAPAGRDLKFELLFLGGNGRNEFWKHVRVGSKNYVHCIIHVSPSSFNYLYHDLRP